jgi:CBS domain-containing protein
LLRLGRREGAGHGAPLAPLPARSAGEVATRPAVVVTPGESLMHVAGMMVERRIHRVFVAQEGKLVGVFSTLDLLRAIAHSRVELQLAEVMSKPAFTLPVASTVAHATDRLAHAHVSGLCIVDEEGWPVGLFSQREALAASHVPGESSVEDAMSYALVCLHGQVPLYRAASLAASSRARRVLVIEHRHVVGVVTPLDFARAVSH